MIRPQRDGAGEQDDGEQDGVVAELRGLVHMAREWGGGEGEQTAAEHQPEPRRRDMAG